MPVVVIANRFFHGGVDLAHPRGGAPERVQTTTWMFPHEEDSAYHSLAPYCGP